MYFKNVSKFYFLREVFLRVNVNNSICVFKKCFCIKFFKIYDLYVFVCFLIKLIFFKIF